METRHVIAVEDAARFEDVVRRAEQGEVIVVTRAGKPVAEVRSASGTASTVDWTLPDREQLIEALAPEDEVADGFEAA